MPGPVRKAVIPAAGLGTRFLPFTKATPKEMLPVVDTPAIQYIVEEAAAAGLRDVIVVTGRGKRPLEDHFDAAPELEAALSAKGDDTRLAIVRATNDLAQMHFVRQREPRGLGHAVLCAAEHVGDEAFAVLLGDDLIDPRDALLRRMLDVQAARGGSAVALVKMPHDQISLYGSAAVSATDEPDVLRLSDLVEKPAPADAPSDYAVVGRYVLAPSIFDAIRETQPGRGGEIQLTDAIRELSHVEPVHGVVFTGRRYDTGDRADYLRTVVRLAVERPDLGPDFLAWLREFVAEHPEEPTSR
ncbi:MAG: UTP--glucose-1-phosphate uridylyltransferase [Mycobacteriales bacterium]|nr:UTP--glucose-1-phosphate uridylyltransferase [Frankia sp.]